MDRKGVLQVMPKNNGDRPVANFVENFTPGYIQRALANWPKQGSKAPWRVYQNYIRDTVSLKWASVDDGVLEFSNPSEASSNPAFSQTGRTSEIAPASLGRIS